jgi:hypothetical protein
MRWPHGREEGRVPTHGIAELDGVRREARRQARWCMHAGRAAWLVTKPSAPGIGDGVAMAGSNRRVHRAQ